MRPPARVSVRVSDALIVAAPYAQIEKWARRFYRWTMKGYIAEAEHLREDLQAVSIFRGRVNPEGRRLVDRVLIAFKTASYDRQGDERG